MRYGRAQIVTALVLMLVVGVAAGALLLSGAFTARATPAPKLSLDMDPTGNGVSASGTFTGNLMTVGTIDLCATVNPGSPIPSFPDPIPLFSTHLIIEDVVDLVGWQARFNYDGTKLNLSAFNQSPFTSTTGGAAIGFTNLPNTGTNTHKATVSAGPDTINFGLSNQSTAFGASYSSAQTAPVSADTPYISDEGTQTYDAPNGGVLAEMTWQVKSGADGDPTIRLDLATTPPPPSGASSTQVVLFTESTTTVVLADSALIDGFLGVNTTCTPPCTTLNPITQVTTPGGGQSGSVNAEVETLFTGNITTTTGLTNHGKNAAKVCANTTLDYDATVGTVTDPVFCTLSGTAVASSGSIAVTTATQKLICTDKPGGSDTDRFRILPQ